MIEVLNFCKEYKSRAKNSFKVQNVSFTVEKGTITGLVGPNGSGKSTVIKAICGFHYPSEGKILITDNENSKFDVCVQNEKAIQLCGYVPENPKLPPDMKVIDFLTYAAKCHNLSKEIARERIKKVCEDFQLSDILYNLIKNLSKGQQQRVSFAQALINNPPNLVLDEPINGLDPSQIITFRKYITKLSASKAILISTHMLSEVNNLCQNAYIMNKGKIHIVQKLQNIEQEFISLTTSAENQLEKAL